MMRVFNFKESLLCKGMLLVLWLCVTVHAMPIEKSYGTDEQLSIKLEQKTSDTSKDVGKDLIDEPDKPSVDEKSANKRAGVEVTEISGDETSGAEDLDDSKDTKNDVKVVATEKVEVGEKRDEFERGLLDDSQEAKRQEAKKSDAAADENNADKKSVVANKKSSSSHKKTGKHVEKKHDVKDAKKRNATVGTGGWWNCGCCNAPCGGQEEHQHEQQQQHHECQHHECEGCHHEKEKDHEHEQHEQHHHKEHGYEKYEEWGAHHGNQQGHEGHHQCCHECCQQHGQHGGHECDQGHKECCHHEEHHEGCCHPNCCQVDVAPTCCPCCNGIGKKK